MMGYSASSIYLCLATSMITNIIAGNKITTIAKHAITNVPNLRYMFVGHNEMNSVDPGVFQQFEKLETIDLSYNNIAEIQADAFKSVFVVEEQNEQWRGVMKMSRLNL